MAHVRRASAPHLPWAEGSGAVSSAAAATTVPALGGGPAIHRTLRSLPRPESVDKNLIKRFSPRETTSTMRPVLTPLDAFMQRVGGPQRRRRSMEETGPVSPQPMTHIKSLRRSLHRTEGSVLARRPSLSRLTPLESNGSPSPVSPAAVSPAASLSSEEWLHGSSDSQAALPLLLRAKPAGQPKAFTHSQSEGTLKFGHAQSEPRASHGMWSDDAVAALGDTPTEKTPKTAWATTPTSPMRFASPMVGTTPKIATPTLSVEDVPSSHSAGASPAGFALGGCVLIEDGGFNAQDFLTRQHADSEGFSTAETSRMRLAFRRFKPFDSSEVSCSELGNVLAHLGYVAISKEAIDKIVAGVSCYSALDFGDFTEFAERFARHEQAEVHAAFNRHIESGSPGRVRTAAIQSLLRTLGVTAMGDAVKNALKAAGLARTSELNSEQFARFLAAYQASEGFCASEIKAARRIFDSEVPARLGGPQEMRVPQLSGALLGFLGLHAASSVRQVLQACRQNQAQGVSFHEFLVWARRARETMLSDLHDCFMQADQDGDGFISSVELGKPMCRLGMTMVRAEIEETLFEAKCTEPVDCDAFIRFVVAARETAGFTRCEVSELREVFTRFDYNASGDIDQIELLDMLRHLGHVTSLEDVHRLIKDMDIDCDGALDFCEFLRLMRFHREMELRAMRSAFDANADPSSGCLRRDCLESAVKALGWSVSCSEIPLPVDSKRGDEGSGGLTFDEFFEVAGHCRQAFAARRRKQAGFSEEQVEHLHELFEAHGGSEGQTIDQGGLARMLTELGVPMATASERAAVFNAVEDARCAAKDAHAEEEELEASDGHTFSSILHLLRSLGCRGERNAVAREMKAMEQIDFSHVDVAEFRSIFDRLIHPALNDPEAASSQGNSDPNMPIDGELGGLPRPEEEPLSALRISLAGDCPRISWQDVWHMLRSLGLRLRPHERSMLGARAAQFAAEGGQGASAVSAEDGTAKLDFAAFLQLVRWMLDTNFGDINGHAARVSCSDSMNMQAALASAVATAMPGRGSDTELASGMQRAPN